MSKLNQLIEDLEKLNQGYLEKTKRNFPQTKEDVEKIKKEDKEAGQLFIDFYNNRFVSEYSESAEIPEKVLWEVNSYLHYLSSTASNYINNEKSYYVFCIGVLLTNKGDIIGEPNNLEKLIQKLKKNLN